MKLSTSIMLVSIICASVVYSKTESMVYHVLNEIKFNSTDWVIEICQDPYYENIDTVSLDSCYLSCKSGRSLLKKGVSLTEEFQLISKDSLIDTLNIDPENDWIKLEYYDNDILNIDEVSFGTNGLFPAPKNGQSLSSSGPFFYLDNSPTIGFQNDAINGKGYIHGKIINKHGDPLHDIKVAFEYITLTPFTSTYTDSEGCFEFEVYATRIAIWYNSCVNDEYIQITVQPDSIVYPIIVIDDTIDNVENKKIIKGFDIIGNYPNPFNNSTSIRFKLSISSEIEFNIFDINGRQVKNLASGFYQSGVHQVVWNSMNSTGVYFLELKSNNLIIRKKCLLLK